MATPERLLRVCDLIAKGETEGSACIACGISGTTWNAAKRAEPGLRERIASARDEWAQRKHAQYMAARYESQLSRAAGRKALRPQPTLRAKWIVRYLTTQVPLNHVAISPAMIAEACQRVDMTAEDWRRQEAAFGLLRKVYAQRAKIRGERPLIQSLFPMDVAPDTPSSGNSLIDQFRA